MRDIEVEFQLKDTDYMVMGSGKVVKDEHHNNQYLVTDIYFEIMGNNGDAVPLNAPDIPNEDVIEGMVADRVLSRWALWKS